MFIPRHLVACVCITSLLISNVAGWMHLGCVESASSCCTPRCSDIAVADAAHSACCGHSHGHCRSRASSSQRRPSTNEATSGGDSIPAGSIPRDRGTPHEHDSDGCSICQSFFVSRTAASLDHTPVPTADEPRPFVVRFPQRVFPHNVFSDSISVRGPPRA